MAQKQLSLGETWRYRHSERRAFIWCFAALTISYIAFIVSGGVELRPDFLNLLPLAIFATSLILTHVVFLISRFQGDPGLVIPVAFLGGLGVLAQFRMGLFQPDNPWRLSHFAYPLGVVVMLGIVLTFKQTRYQWLQSFKWIAALGALGIVAALLVTGSRFRGALYASGGLTPTEFIKLLVVLFLAGHLAVLAQSAAKGKRKAKGPSEWGTLLPIIGYYSILLALLLYQRDLGMVAILGGLAVVLVVTTTGKWHYVFLASILAVVGGAGAYQMFLHSQQRIQVWLNPLVDPTGSSWQLLQGLSAMFSGGLWGAGFGEGNPERIPIAASDFIYAVIGEELGYVGCLAVVLLFLGFFRRAFRVASLSADPYGAVLVTGLTTTIALQTFLNIGGVTKTVPLTGIPLPFISHGGSSLVTMFACLGLILAVADSVPPQLGKQKTQKEKKPKKKKG